MVILEENGCRLGRMGESGTCKGMGVGYLIFPLHFWESGMGVRYGGIGLEKVGSR